MKKSILLVFLLTAVLMPMLIFAKNTSNNPQNQMPIPASSINSVVQNNPVASAEPISQNTAPNSEEITSGIEIPQEIIFKIKESPFLLLGANYLMGGSLIGSVVSNNDYISQFAEGYLEESNKEKEKKNNDQKMEPGDTIAGNVQSNNFDGLAEKLRSSIRMKLK
jgi:hypothetical protein